MGKRRKSSQFWESSIINNRTYQQHYNRLTELSISMFEWKNLPPTVDPRFLEMALFTDGMSIFFEDEVLGFLALQCMIGGKLSVYRIPTERRAYATNGYNRQLNEKNSVIIFNNYLHTNSMLDVEMFSRRLYELDRAIDINAKAQKTPVLIQCSENERLTMKNLYEQYDGNEPFIFGSKGLDANGLKVLQTGAPYVADRLYELKMQLWNEALTYLGISNMNVVKKARLSTEEVATNQGGTIASRYSRLESRREACRKINEMFGLDMWVDYREDFQDIREERNNNEEEKEEYTGGDDNE